MSADWQMEDITIIATRPLNGEAGELRLLQYNGLVLETIPGKRNALILYVFECGYQVGLEWYDTRDLEVALANFEKRMAANNPKEPLTNIPLIDIPFRRGRACR